MSDQTHGGPPSSAHMYLNDQIPPVSSPDDLPDSVVADEHPRPEGLSFSIAMDDAAGAFVATADGVEFGAVPFVEKAGRVVLLATSILPEYRGRGLATALIRRVLDQIRVDGRRVTVRCPVFQAFIERHPEYEALLDPTDPGMVRRNDV